jgi:hypothetical protein
MGPLPEGRAQVCGKLHAQVRKERVITSVDCTPVAESSRKYVTQIQTGLAVARARIAQRISTALYGPAFMDIPFSSSSSRNCRLQFTHLGQCLLKEGVNVCTASPSP